MTSGYDFIDDLNSEEKDLLLEMILESLEKCGGFPNQEKIFERYFDNLYKQYCEDYSETISYSLAIEDLILYFWSKLDKDTMEKYSKSDFCKNKDLWNYFIRGTRN